VAFVLALGVLIGLGGREVASSVTFTSTTGIATRVSVGLLLVTLGLIQAEVLAITFHAVDRLTQPVLKGQAAFRRRHPILGLVAFGFAYLIIGFGWAGPILAGLASQALTTGGFGAAFVAYVVAGSAIVLLAFGAALFVALAHEQVTERVGANAPAIKRWGGYILVVVGLWLVALGVFADFFAGVFPVWPR
jgi:cytochrome c biogenesis protein CcdA